MKVTMRAMRVNRGYTQEQLAKKLGVTKATVMNWEKGNCVMDAPTLLTLCSIYECSVDDIILPEKLAKREHEKEDAIYE